MSRTKKIFIVSVFNSFLAFSLSWDLAFLKYLLLFLCPAFPVLVPIFLLKNHYENSKKNIFKYYQLLCAGLTWSDCLPNTS